MGLPQDPPQIALLRPSAVPAKLDKVTTVAFEGGGVLGMAYLPVIEALAPLGNQVTEFAGASAGAITALLLALRTPPRRVQELLETTDWRAFAAYRPPALLRLFTRGGWHTIGQVRSWLAERIKEARLVEDVTFGELRDAKGTRLHVVATRYLRRGDGPTEAEPHVFSIIADADAPVLDAVLASMAVPIFWPPVQVGGFWYCDGGVAMNHPVSVFAAYPPETVLGVRVDTHRELETWLGRLTTEPVKPSLRAIVTANAEMLREVANRSYVPEATWSRIVRVDIGTQSALDFRLGDVQRGRLVNAGRVALEEWLAEEKKEP